MADAKTATPEAPKAAPPDVIAILEDKVMTVGDLLAKSAPLAVASAWGAGDVEFGRRTYVVVGKPGKPDSRLIVEAGWDWTGPKTVAKKGFRDLWADEATAVPECREYRLYAPAREGDPVEPNKSPLTELTAEAAKALLALRVRLTDKGMGQLQVS